MWERYFLIGLQLEVPVQCSMLNGNFHNSGKSWHVPDLIHKLQYVCPPRELHIPVSIWVCANWVLCTIGLSKQLVENLAPKVVQWQIKLLLGTGVFCDENAIILRKVTKNSTGWVLCLILSYQICSVQKKKKIPTSPVNLKWSLEGKGFFILSGSRFHWQQIFLNWNSVINSDEWARKASCCFP